MHRVAQKIGFLHIPKTAGVSINSSFVQRLGKANCLLFSPEMSDATFERKVYVSGHIYCGDITAEAAFLFTFLREPLNQIASHLMWIDHLNMPKNAHATATLPASVQVAIGQLGKIDVSSATELDNYLQWLPRDSDLRVRNVQSELLAFCRDRVVPLCDRDLADLAIKNCARLDFLGTTANLSQDLSRLFRMLGLGHKPLVSHDNKSPSERKIDLKVASIARVLQKHVEADYRLYENAVGGRIALRLQELFNTRSWRWPFFESLT